MASIKHTPGREEKASSLDSLFSARPQAGQAPGDAGDRRGRYGTAGFGAKNGREKNLSWLVDVIILLLIVGVAAAVYVYVIRPVLRNHGEIWDEKKLVCTVELPDIDASLVSYDRDGTLSVMGRDIWTSASADSGRIGLVKACVTTISVHEDGRQTVTLLLTVEADARFRSGEGYFAGDTRLLCGETRTFRLWGLTAEGSILTMREKED